MNGSIMLRILLTCATLAFSAAPAVSSEADLIEFLKDELNDLREEIVARDDAPEEAAFLKEDKADHQGDIDAILDKAIKFVVPDTFETWSGQIDKIAEATQEAEAKRAELLLERLEAGTSTGVGMVEKALGREFERGSVEDIDRRVGELDVAINQLGIDREAVIVGFAQDMKRKHDVTLTEAQAQAILYSVNGEIMIESTVVLNALGEIERRLARVMDQKIGVDARREYIGVASATRLIHVRLLERHLAQYEGEWLPALAAMRKETETLLSRTRQEVSNTSQESVRNIYANNIELQQRIISVIDRYSEMLERRRELTSNALTLAVERAEAAVNTLMTLDTAASLSSVIAEATTDYEDVMGVDLPELEKLDPEEFEEMLDISRRLNS